MRGCGCCCRHYHGYVSIQENAVGNRGFTADSSSSESNGRRGHGTGAQRQRRGLLALLLRMSLGMCAGYRCPRRGDWRRGIDRIRRNRPQIRSHLHPLHQERRRFQRAMWNSFACSRRCRLRGPQPHHRCRSPEARLHASGGVFSSNACSSDA